MWTALLVACASDPVFVEPPDAPVGNPFLVPSLAGCTYTQDGGSVAVTWTYDQQGHLLTDAVSSGSGDDREATYRWQGRCLQEVTALYGDQSSGESSDYGYSSYDGSSQKEVSTFLCDPHGNWTEWNHHFESSAGPINAGETYRYVNTYDAGGQLSEVQVWLGGAQLLVASYLWYDEVRPLEVVFQEPAGGTDHEGGSNTTTWIWDHDRLLGWDLRGSGAERTMERIWNKDQLTNEVHTEEEVEGLSFEYTYQDESSPFPQEVWVSPDPWPPLLDLPRPKSALEYLGGLSNSSEIEVKCK